MKRTAGALTALTALAFFLLSSCPTIFVGDSGEVVSAAYSLGVPHPPGYPLFIILGKLFTYIPAGTIAFRVNMLAAALGALAAFFLFILLKRLNARASGDKGSAIPALASLLFAFSLTFWQQCTQAKGGIYPLNIALLLAVILSIIDGLPFWLTGILAGMALANHNTAIPLLFLIALFAWLRKRGGNTLSGIFKAGGTALLTAAAFYIFMMLRAGAHPAMNWGDPETLTGLFRHIARAQYGTISGNERTFTLFLGQSWIYLKALASQFLIIPALLAIPGALLLFKRAKYFTLLMLLIFLFTSAGFILLTNFSLNANNIYMINVFYIPSYLALIIFFAFFISGLKQRKAVIAGAAILLCGTVFLNFNYCDRSNDWTCYDNGINILKSADPGRVLVVVGDHMAFTTAYLTMVEKKGAGYRIYDDYGLIFGNDDPGLKKIPPTEYTERLNYVKSVTLAGIPSYFTMGSGIHKYIAEIRGLGIKVVPCGILYMVCRENEKPKMKDITAFKLRNSEDPKAQSDFSVRSITAAHFFFTAQYLELIGKKADAAVYFDKAGKAGKDDQTMLDALGVIQQNSGNVQSAIENTKRAVELDPHDPDLWNNYGAALSRIGDHAGAADAYRKAIKINPAQVTFYNNLAAALTNMDQPGQALEYYSKALSMNEKAVNYYGLGMTYTRLKDPVNAEKYLKRGIELGASPELYFGLGNLYLSQGKLQDAVNAYKAGLKLNPAHTGILNNLGVAYINLKDLPSATATFETLTRAQPNNPDAHNNLGLCYYNAGMKEKAIAEWKEVLRIDPNNKNVKDVLEKLK